MAMEADSWLKKADDLEHQYSLPPDQLAQSVDDLGLLQTADEPPDADTDTTAASSPFKVGHQQGEGPAPGYQCWRPVYRA